MDSRRHDRARARAGGQRVARRRDLHLPAPPSRRLPGWRDPRRRGREALARAAARQGNAFAGREPLRPDQGLRLLSRGQGRFARGGACPRRSDRRDRPGGAGRDLPREDDAAFRGSGLSVDGPRRRRSRGDAPVRCRTVPLDLVGSGSRRRARAPRRLLRSPAGAARPHLLGDERQAPDPAVRARRRRARLRPRFHRDGRRRVPRRSRLARALQLVVEDLDDRVDQEHPYAAQRSGRGEARGRARD